MEAGGLVFAALVEAHAQRAFAALAGALCTKLPHDGRRRHERNAQLADISLIREIALEAAGKPSRFPVSLSNGEPIC